MTPPARPLSVRRLLTVISLIAFAAALFTRTLDPVIPPIAHDLAVDPATAALLSTGFALPFALIQPILGPLADIFGKTRMMTICILILVLMALLGAVATSFPLLLATRVVAGMAAGGVFPVALATVGDLVPVAERQVALGRYLAIVITGGLLGTVLGGIVGDLFGWRAVLVVTGAFAVAGFVAALTGFRGVPRTGPGRFEVAAVIAGYRTIFANPRAKVCYAAVCLEGVAIFGLFPYVALLLVQRGEGRALIAGAVLAGFAVGGIGYSLVVRFLLARFAPSRLMIFGGAAAAVALIGAALARSWPVELISFGLLGFGFYMLHASIQVQATELAPMARGAAMALHSFFFFVGQAVGPVLYGIGFAKAGTLPTLAAAAVVILAVGIACAYWLGDRPGAPPAKSST